MKIENGHGQKLIRRVVEFGNGAHVSMPKEWLGDEVVLMRIPKKSFKEAALKLINPHLDKVVAAFIYGSYARGEQTKNSDIDLFVISDKKIKLGGNGFDIITIEKGEIGKAIKSNPLLIFSMANEAKAIVNSSFLDELKNIEIRKDYFNEFIKTTKENIRTNLELIRLDKGEKYLSSNSAVYSLILRLRGIFLINCLLNKKKYSNLLFKKWIIGKIRGLDYEKVYGVYQDIRDNKKTSEKVLLKDAEALLNLLEKETEKW